MKQLRTTKRVLRRFLLETQLLLHTSEERTSSAHSLPQIVMDVIRQLECVQIDPVSAVRANQHLVLAARIADYDPEILNQLLRQNEVFEYWANAACIIPMEDYPIFEPTRQRLREQIEPNLDKIRAVAEQVLKKLDSEGPLPAKSFESDQRVHGYWDNVSAKTKATSHALNLLTDAAQIRIVGREGNQRLFHLIKRTVPDELLEMADRIDTADALAAMMHKYFRAYRVFEPSDARFGWQRLSASERRKAIERRVQSGEVMPVEVEGLNKPYYILSSDANRLLVHADGDQAGDGEMETEIQVLFLPPLDNLLWSRKRLTDLFEFDYRWEIYTPAVKRKYGYYAMPILAGDRLIGLMDPRLDKKNRHLTVELLHIDPRIDYTEHLRVNVQRGLESFARHNGADTFSIAKSS